MAITTDRAPVVRKETLAEGFFSYTVSCPEIASAAKAGQFVNVLVPEKALRRPISICEIDREAGTIRLVFQIRGDGTRRLASFREGDLLDLLGPLGNGFAVCPGEKAVLVGGGIGVPPLLELAKAFSGNASAVLGFRDASAVILEEDFNAVCSRTLLYTDNGTAGEKGFVTDGLKALLERERPDVVCACGPEPMLKGVIALAKEAGVRCQVSLEQRMACGVGACYVCACRLVMDGETFYGHVCKDGPVFDAGSVVL